jgi:Transcriptional regulator, AbiEi antitoxin
VPIRDGPWVELAENQAGIVTRAQLLALGWSPSQVKQPVAAGRWVTVLPGVYATFTGDLSDQARVWAAVLHGGPGAAASHQTALWLGRALDRMPAVLDVSIPANRRGRTPAWIRLHRRRRLLVHPGARPTRTRIEAAALDSADGAGLDEALGYVFAVTQRRLTTGPRLSQALSARPRHRWRALLREVLTEVDDGVASPLELRYARAVERAHGLPRGRRNEPEAAPGGGNWYRDVRYRTFATVVELDGREAHPPGQRFRDLRRDNVAAVRGEAVLRYGWRDVAGRPCSVAAQVAAVLTHRGWPGSPHPCGPRCTLPPDGRA